MPTTVTARTIHVLIVDDDEDDYFITRDYMRDIEGGRFEISWCYRYTDALQAMKERRYDIYLVDYRLGARTGLDLLKDAIASHCEEPIILLTGKGNPEVDRKAMQEGAADYLVKTELTAEQLERTLRYALEHTFTLKALKAQERKYRTIFEQSKDAVFLSGENLRFKDVNAATLELLASHVEDILNATLFDFMVDERQKAALAEIVASGREIDDFEIELRTREGDTRYCIFSSSLIAEDDTTNAYLQGILHDITNIRRAERATLLAEKLASAGRLVRTLAHEVRNPLNNINLSAEQLQAEGSVSGNDRVYLEIIQRNSNRIGDLITELLNSSKPTEVAFQDYSLQSILDGSLAQALDRITIHKVNVRVHYPDQEIIIKADKEKLCIAFLNIIINAVEATEMGMGEIDIMITPVPTQHKVIIRDNGSGISEEHLSRLFEPYFTSKRNGMGLGLAATLNILQAHKAEVDVQSAPGKGTTFTVSFPAKH